jgi:DNA-binding GntR family transcriptional regulator
LPANSALSRTPVVQALQRLAADGIVTLEMNKRAVVRPGAENWLVELHELRELLEPAAAARASPGRFGRGPGHAGPAGGEAEPHSHPDWQPPAQRFDFALHLTIADRCGNFALARHCERSGRSSGFRTGIPEPAETLERGYFEHMAICPPSERRCGNRASRHALSPPLGRFAAG